MKKKKTDVNQPEVTAEVSQPEDIQQDGKKSKKPKKTRKQKAKIALIVVSSILGAIIVVLAVFMAINAIAVTAHLKLINSFDPVGCSITPTLDEENNTWTFETDDEFKVLQLTDIHIGGGTFSIKTDNWAINAVETIIRNVKPDLVIITGDIAFPEPFQSGSSNNKREAEMFATLMENLGVYWAFCFGNHDTEIYSFYDRAAISEFYQQDRWEHCLYLPGDSNVDGFGNYVINVQKTNGIITHSFIMLDSHSYLDDDPLGMLWHYDGIHQNQIEWYKITIQTLNQKNQTTFASLSDEKKLECLPLLVEANEPDQNTITVDGKNYALPTIKSSVLFHIPLEEYDLAWKGYVANNKQETEDIKFIMGDCKENNQLICYGTKQGVFFDVLQEVGSTKNVFCGHDHLNTFVIDYKGITLTYGMSIDYLAYIGIYKKTSQRGGTIINVKTDGDLELIQKPLVDCK